MEVEVHPAAFDGHQILRCPALGHLHLPFGGVAGREAACWAHLRQDLYDIRIGTKYEIAREALDRIGALRHRTRDHRLLQRSASARQADPHAPSGGEL
ncbi:transposase [Paracoccus sp. C2R09]|uniref:IS66 family transposase n=1 Tax=Paracoccus sp. C2R09 TaxID=2839896 RepID=UPI00353052BB